MTSKSVLDHCFNSGLATINSQATVKKVTTGANVMASKINPLSLAITINR
ncbi:hypothetical protein J7384_05040 [Endozoicomonas sp. G2_1]|nr:hypothetical protein [Endozoicomonas sp. G2_1]MBO9489726.1 hypothetical protein [Endozoicomonas sp. G2_1]